MLTTLQIAEQHKRLVAALLECNANPRGEFSTRAQTLRGLIATCEKIDPSLEQQRIDMMVKRDSQIV